MKNYTVDNLNISIFDNREAMGVAAARMVAKLLREISESQSRIRVVFACAPSQDEFLSGLLMPEIGSLVPWEKMEVFHMDDYIGLSAEDPQSFRYYLHQHLLDHVNVAAFHPIIAEADDPVAECSRYQSLLADAPIDLICLGIGENGHLAFNDPPVADFDDPDLVKIVNLDHSCRQQQVNDGCFLSLDAVPQQAITLTLPVFRDARNLSCVVPGSTKARAVQAAVEHPLSTDWPCTQLRSHPKANLFLDSDSASLI